MFVRKLVFYTLLGFVVLSHEKLYCENNDFCTTIDINNVDDAKIQETAKQLIKFIVDNYLDKLQSPEIEFKEKKKIFKSCFEKYFAIRKISGFVLGKYVREIDASEKELFVKYFSARVTDMYTKQFDNFRNISVNIQSVEKMTMNHKDIYIVHTLIDADNSSNNA